MDPLFDKLNELVKTWPAPEWTWDARLSTITSSFGHELEAKARASAGHALPQEFTATTLATAPPVLRALTERTGGLRVGQLLFANSDFEGILLYGLWWPWGGGDTITLRIGIAHRDRTLDPFPRLRALVGISP